MKRIALFQFHTDWDVCMNRIRMLRARNPEVDIYGLFGGESPQWAEARHVLAGQFVDIYNLRDRDRLWKWQNTDLAVRQWYCDAGHQVQFDVVHVLQWDLLIFDSLENAYRGVPCGAVALSGITTVDAISSRWHWTTHEPHKTQLTQLKEFAREHYADQQPLQACLGPGYCLPREFLSLYAAANVPTLGHDELRLPLFARLLGFQTVDTGFYRGWFNEAEEMVFNANGDEIQDSVIEEELRRVDGRRVFHPYRRVFEGSP